MRGKLIPAVIAAVLVSAVSLPAASAARREISTNWSGYSVSGAAFTAISGDWVQPAATCPVGGSTVEARASFWIGLGGNERHGQSAKVEQIGAESDCDPEGHTFYFAWYELWPAGNHPLERFAVRPGDRMTAGITVAGGAVSFVLRDRTSGRVFRRTIVMRKPDVSSAEWIAEAPARVTGGGRQIFPLANFGSVHFTGASASADDRVGPITDSHWHHEAIDFMSAEGYDPVSSFLQSSSAAHGFPSGLSRHGSSFWITWKPGELPVQKQKKVSPGAI